MRENVVWQSGSCCTQHITAMPRHSAPGHGRMRLSAFLDDSDWSDWYPEAFARTTHMPCDQGWKVLKSGGPLPGVTLSRLCRGPLLRAWPSALLRIVKQLDSPNHDPEQRIPTTLGARWSEVRISKTSRLPMGPTQPPIQWVAEFFPVGKAAGAWC